MELRITAFRVIARVVKTVSVLLICLGSSLCFGQFAGGEGTAESPYQVGTAVHLNNVRDYLNSHFIQTADIDLGVAPWNEGEGWVPIGGMPRFAGTYNGNGKVIRNLNINRPEEDYQSLFGRGADMVTISNLGLQNVDITGRDYVAAVLARGINNTTIQYCYVTGTIKGRNTVAGIAAISTIVLDSYTTAYVTATIKNTNAFVAGINVWGDIQRSYTAGRVETVSIFSFAGAVTASRTGEYENVYWNKDICGQEWGIPRQDDTPGVTTRQMMLQETYQGFDFENIWRIDEGSYPYLQWQGEEAEEHNFPPLLPPAGLTAIGRDRMVALSWIVPDDLFGVPEGYNIYRGGIQINDELVGELEFLDDNLLNWTTYYYVVRAVYDGEESMGSNVAVTCTNEFEGSGTEADPYLIENAIDLDRIRLLPNSRFRQTADIDLGVAPWNTGTGWQAIGHLNPHIDIDYDLPFTPFQGSYDGSGYSIKNLTVTDPYLVGGLFGGVRDATIKNIVLENVNLSETQWLGALAYYLGPGSTIENITASGVVSGNYVAGGIVAKSSGTIINCSWDGDVYGITVGGIAGENYGTVGNSSSKGTVTVYLSSVDQRGGGGLIGVNLGLAADSYSRSSIETQVSDKIGGLIGFNRQGEVLRCYSAGEINPQIEFTGGLIGVNYEGSVIDSYWDTEMSGMDNSSGGEGKTTEEMTYPYDGNMFQEWDFENVWRADSSRRINNGYPVLKWENIPFPKNITNPVPENDSEDISVALEELKWSYYPDDVHTKPSGFRVYFGETDNFENAVFCWVDYDDEQTEFRCYDILPQELAYNTVYYWQVIPTTKEEGEGEGEDADNVPVWLFSTETDTGVQEEDILPVITALIGNYPNPFNPETVIRFAVAKDNPVMLTIYNVRGQLVRNLHNGVISAGEHSIIWDGKDNNNRPVGSGLYLYRLTSGYYTHTRRMILMK